MSSQMLKVKYIQCSKGGFHQGQLLNTICLNNECRINPLCCCACVQEYHNGHKTTTLKKFLIDAKQTAENSKGNEKQAVKMGHTINTDILHNLIESDKKQTFEKFKKTSESIKATLNQIQEGLTNYYDNLEVTIKNQGNNNAPVKIFEAIQNIQGSTNFSTMLPNIQKLLSTLEMANAQGKIVQKPMAQDSIINLIQQSNKEVIQASTTRLAQIRDQIQKGGDLIFQSTLNVQNIFNRDIFTFSTTLKSNDIWVTDSYKSVSKKGSTYQAILMEPDLNSGGDITAFKFYIKKLNANWIAIGIGHRKILQSKKFAFEYKSTGHGCYMISSNAGTWSHTTQDLNNKVKAFTFKEGDTITCIVNRKMRQIFFVKDIPASVINISPSQRQIYELPYFQNASDPLHPCVVYYYENDQVQYLPAVNLSNIPHYQYLFSQTWKNPRVKIIDNRMIKALDGNSQYRAALLNKCLEQNFQTVKRFSFRIVRSTNNWVAVGMCHAKTAANSGYGFNYQSSFHGYYMVSSNGGSWSCIDAKKNNVVKAFKFAQGDVIECQVVFGNGPHDVNNKIIFRKGLESYELTFKGVAGDRLYPCAMVHFAHDEIGILPSF